MQTPEFWSQEGITPTLLSPASWLYGRISQRRLKRPASFTAPVPVICIGNLVAGGAGKTPIAMAMGQMLTSMGKRVFFLSRGYGGHMAGPVLVKPDEHSAKDVGDEALLLAAQAPTIIARDRAAGAKAATEHGADVIIMDDGFQNPSLHKNFSLLVVDGRFGFGNKRLLPAGPLRETIASGMARAQAVVLLQPVKPELLADIPATMPVFHAHMLTGSSSESLHGKRVIAFAGIGRPEKFFATLHELKCEIVEMHAFGDHHMFTTKELDSLEHAARKHDAQLVTTTKDYVRLPAAMREQVRRVEISIVFEDEPGLRRTLASLFLG